MENTETLSSRPQDRQRRRRATLLGTTAAALGLLVSVAVPAVASAHVGIEPATAEPGSTATVTVTAASESDTASTVSLELMLPTDTPILSVRYQPQPGWSAEVVEEELPQPVTVSGNTITEAATRVIFTADPGGGIRPGEFQEWRLRLGPIPDTGRLAIPAVQTYDDGTVVEWSATAEEAQEDDTLNPAPTLFVNDEPVADDHGAPVEEEATASQDAAAVPSWLVALAVAGLALGVLGVVTGGAAWVAQRKAVRA